MTPYNEQWVSLFEEEANKLHEIFGSEIIHIHHIGSTSRKRRSTFLV
nr:GrpB family protein [Priestia megaterium]